MLNPRAAVRIFPGGGQERNDANKIDFQMNGIVVIEQGLLTNHNKLHSPHLWTKVHLLV